MKVDKRLLRQIAPEGGIRPGRSSADQRKKERESRDIARRVSRKRLKRLLDKEIEE